MEFGRPGLFSRHVLGGLCDGCLPQFPFWEKKCCYKACSREVGGEMCQSHYPGPGNLVVSDGSFVLCEGAFIVCIRQSQAEQPLEASPSKDRCLLVLPLVLFLIPPSPRKGSKQIKLPLYAASRHHRSKLEAVPPRVSIFDWR